MKNRSMIAHWVPAVFCAFLSLTALAVQIRANAPFLMAAFFCFLPMCFFFVGVVTASNHRELLQLRDRLAALERELSAAPRRLADSDAA